MNRLVLIVMAVIGIFMNSFSEDTILKFIFVPHARTEAKTGDMIITGIRNIDFTKFSLKMLGGDLTQTTSKDSATMAYCDKFFDLGNPNTLWSIGNHDVESGSRELIKKFTKRDTYYTYARDGVQFLILDTELDAPSFSSSSILGAQLDTVKAVCNRVTSADTKFFIVLNSRFIWMANNPDFTQAFKDSNVAASSKSLSTTNFSKDVYPLLQAVKAKGIQVMWFSGDKARANVINYIYNKADSIPFYAAKMENTDPDSTNYVVILTYTKNKKMQCDYVRLTHVNTWTTGALPHAIVSSSNGIAREQALKILQISGKKEITIALQTGNNKNGLVQIFRINGAMYYSKESTINKAITVHIDNPGIYIAQATVGNTTHVKKFIIR
jgi:hypothetical protein